MQGPSCILRSVICEFSQRFPYVDVRVNSHLYQELGSLIFMLRVCNFCGKKAPNRQIGQADFHSRVATNMILEVKIFPKYLTPWGSEWLISNTPLKYYAPPKGGLLGLGISNYHPYESFYGSLRICKDNKVSRYNGSVGVFCALWRRTSGQTNKQRDKRTKSENANVGRPLLGLVIKSKFFVCLWRIVLNIPVNVIYVI